MATAQKKRAALLVAFGVAAVFGLLGWKTMRESKTTHSSITAVLTGSLILPLDPENISTIPLYHIHSNLWGTLLDSTQKECLAKTAEVSTDGLTYTFDILPSAKFSNGRKITASDVIFSIKRIMRRQPSGHFNAKAVIRDIEAVSDSRILIRLNEPTPAFIFILSLPEMGIVPRESLDANDTIVDFSITSGAYTLEGAPGTDSVILKKNPYFPQHVPNSPEHVRVLFRRGSDALTEAVKNENADFAEFYESTGVAAFESLKDRAGYSYKATRPSYSVFMVADTKRLSDKERRAVAALVAARMSYKPNALLEQRSFELLPPGSFGSLEMDRPAIAADRLNLSDLPKKLTFRTWDKKNALVENLVGIFRDAGIDVSIVTDDKTPADITFRGQGMNLDFPEIEFHLNMLSPWSYINSSESETAELRRSIHAFDNETRSKLIQKVGRALISDGRIIPVLVRSYVHLFRQNHVNVDGITNYDGDVRFYLMKVTD